MKQRHQYHSTLLLVLLLGAASSSAAALPSKGARPGEGSGPCRVETAAGLPSWITTGVWNNNRLLVVDVVERKLVEITPRGAASEVQAAIGDYLAGSSVTRIRPGAGKGEAPVIVEFAEGRLLKLDGALTPRRRIEMSTTELQSGDRQMTHLIDWILSGDGKEVIGYADLAAPEKEGRFRWRNAFVRFKLDNPSSFKIVHERPFPADSRMGMHLTYPLMASLKQTAYVALIDGQMRLWRFGPQDTELQPVSLQAFPEHLRDKLAPMLPGIVGWDDFPSAMETVSQSEMPAGLFAWEDMLYLLSRRVEKGQRQWFLSKIDPGKNEGEEELLWTVQVPSTAHHLTVIPGATEWAFLEKGPVAAQLNQATHHILFLSSERLRSAALKSLCR